LSNSRIDEPPIAPPWWPHSPGIRTALDPPLIRGKRLYAALGTG